MFFGRFGSASLAGIAAFALTANSFFEVFHTARLSVALVVLLLLHLLRYPRLLFAREFALYAIFLAYMFLALLWTNNVVLAINTLAPATNFLLILLLFGSLLTNHDVHAVLVGTLGGFLAGAITYTLVSGFPLARPADFSYNAIASMYLFGLFVTLLTNCYVKSKGVLLLTGLLLALCIVATTSIKTNLGVLLGLLSVGLFYFGHFVRQLRRRALGLLVLASVLGYTVISNENAWHMVETGVARVMLGIDIIQARDGVAGYSAAGSRAAWFADGLRGWLDSPMFGHGVEAFRSRYDITSHSTPIDLLYNTGFIGFALFYSIFLSLGWRLMIVRDDRFKSVSALILGAIVCYTFITLSGTIHYNAFLAFFVAASVALVRKFRIENFALRPVTQ